MGIQDWEAASLSFWCRAHQGLGRRENEGKEKKEEEIGARSEYNESRLFFPNTERGARGSRWIDRKNTIRRPELFGGRSDYTTGSRNGGRGSDSRRLAYRLFDKHLKILKEKGAKSGTNFIETIRGQWGPLSEKERRRNRVTTFVIIGLFPRRTGENRGWLFLGGAVLARGGRRALGEGKGKGEAWGKSRPLVKKCLISRTSRGRLKRLCSSGAVRLEGRD